MPLLRIHANTGGDFYRERYRYHHGGSTAMPRLTSGIAEV